MREMGRDLVGSWRRPGCDIKLLGDEALFRGEKAGEVSCPLTQNIIEEMMLDLTKSIEKNDDVLNIATMTIAFKNQFRKLICQTRLRENTSPLCITTMQHEHNLRNPHHEKLYLYL